MVAVTNKGKILRRAANSLLGDRVKMTSLTIEGGKIVGKTLGFAANVATCCPSVAGDADVCSGRERTQRK